MKFLVVNEDGSIAKTVDVLNVEDGLMQLNHGSAENQSLIQVSNNAGVIDDSVLLVKDGKLAVKPHIQDALDLELGEPIAHPTNQPRLI